MKDLKNKEEKIEKVEAKKNKVKAATPTLTESIKRRITWLTKQMGNIETEVAVLEKRKKKYIEGLPKVEKALGEYRAKKEKLIIRKEKELEQIRQLSSTFLGAERGDKDADNGLLHLKETGK